MSKVPQLSVPKHKVYEIPDIFTRIDEELAEIIKGLNIIITQLHAILTRMGERVVIQQQTPTPVFYQPPSMPQFQQKAVEIFERIERIDTFKLEASPDEYKDINLYGDVIVITPEDTILLSGRPDAPGIPVYPGVYMTFKKSEKLNRIYIKSNTGSTVNVYFMVLTLEGGGT